MSLRSLKLILLSSAVLSLSGCAVVAKMYNAYFMAKYDSVEYALVNKIRSIAELGVDDCKEQSKSKDNFEGMYFIAVELKNFTQYIPNNPDANKLAGNLVELTKQGRDMYVKGNVSEGFCKMKLQQINRTSETAQKVIGAKPR